MKINLNIKNNVFLPVYKPFLEDYSKRYNVYWGGRGSGKTKFLIQLLFIKGLKEKRFILLMQKQQNKLKDTLWKEILEVMDEFKMRPYFEINKTDLRLTCKLNGTEYRCIGLEEPERIKGYSNISDVLIDEATAFTKGDLDLIDGTVRSNKYFLPLGLYYSFNPVSKANFIYKYFQFDKGEVPPNTRIVHTTYRDNPYLAPSYVENMENLKERDYTRWRIEAEGVWASLDQLVYTNWEEKVFDYQKIKGTLCLGLDFGFMADPSAFVCSLVDEENKIIYIFREWVQRGKTNPEIADVISSLGFSKSLIIADSAEQKSIEELRRLGLNRIRPSEKGPDSVIHGIQRIQQYHLVVHPSCVETITELNNYAWEKDKASGEYINKPQDLFNHCMDGLRYSLQCLNINKLKAINKSYLGL